MKIGIPGNQAPLPEEIARQARLQPCGLSFEEFMRLALYHPEYGYYSRPRPIGKEGDFFTSVSVGPCFGTLLARQIRQIYESLGSPSPFCVIEQGAHSGDLARDILHAWPTLQYRLVEPVPALRECQLHNLHEIQPNIRHVACLDELREPNAVFLCNELLDAFPVRRLHFTGNRWEEWRVVEVGGSLRFRSCSLHETGFPLPAWVPSTAPDGFTLEVCPSLAPWMESLNAAIQRGVALIIDYGLTREERLTPERHHGTVRAYRQHRLISDLLESPGDTDLTWHIDFTSLIEAAHPLGWNLLGFNDQAHFLTGVAAPWLRSLEGQADHPLIAQFKTLTHPGIMGRSFRVLALSKNAGPGQLDGFRHSPPPPPAPGFHSSFAAPRDVP